MRALYPGSFDPPHLGHLDLIERVAHLVDHLVVAVAVNPDKKPFLALERRVELLRSLCNGLGNVVVDSYRGQTLAFAKRRSANVLVRGIRNGADLEVERGMSTVHRGI